MPQDVHIHVALEVVGGEPSGMFLQQLVADLDIIQHFVRLKESAIIGKYLVLLALEACVHITEILLHTIVERTVFVHLFQLLPLIDDLHHRIGREQTAVLSKEDEQQTIKQFLSFLEE